MVVLNGMKKFECNLRRETHDDTDDETPTTWGGQRAMGSSYVEYHARVAARYISRTLEEARLPAGTTKVYVRRPMYQLDAVQSYIYGHPVGVHSEDPECSDQPDRGVEFTSSRGGARDQQERGYTHSQRQARLRDAHASFRSYLTAHRAVGRDTGDD